MSSLSFSEMNAKPQVKDDAMNYWVQRNLFLLISELKPRTSTFLSVVGPYIVLQQYDGKITDKLFALSSTYIFLLLSYAFI